MAVVQGHRGNVRFNGTSLHIYRWSVDWRTDVFDVTNFLYFGCGAYLPGLYDADVSVDACYDVADDPFNLVFIQPGEVMAVTLEYDVGLSVTPAKWTFPTVLIGSSRVDTSVRDVVRYSITGRVTVDSDADNAPSYPQD